MSDNDNDCRLDDSNQCNSQQHSNDNTEKRHTVFRIVMIILVLLLILLLFVKCNNRPQYMDIRWGTIELNGEKDLQSAVNNIVDDGMFQIFINTNISVDRNGLANLLIQNNIKNKYDTYVTISSNDLEVFKSDIIKPGYKLEKAVLNIEPGVYDCVATFHTVDNNNKEVNSVNINVTITRGE